LEEQAPSTDRTHTPDSWWFVKSRRAQSPEDYETWITGGVSPTLNAFDNGTESRATVIAFAQNQREEVRELGEVAGAVQAEPGTHQQTFVAVLGVAFDEMNFRLTPEHQTLRAGTPQSTGVLAYNIHSGSKRADRPEGGMYVNETEIARTLDTTGGLEPSKNDGGVAIVASTVRRLTPMECERLQGFPDGWTAERYDYKKETVTPQADSARYKQMGERRCRAGL